MERKILLEKKSEALDIIIKQSELRTELEALQKKLDALLSQINANG